MVRRPQLSYRSTLKLIKEVKKHPCLWDRGDKHFNDRYNVGLAWKTIACRLQITEEALKLKWKNLRDTFNREVKKNAGSVSEYTGNWAFFNEMLFTAKPERLESVADIEEQYLDIHDEEKTTELELEDEKPDDYYDLLFLESLTPYFKQLEPIRRLAMRNKIQTMLMKEISIQKSEHKREANKDLVYIDTAESNSNDMDSL
ncbi:hypothetical protein ABMA27_014992 [Loxostege sticticalis]|uniref:MADF domain-containing protein n=1 Tax=Loxostege sticticalis TaxID=481309 RepID=A0ABR3IAW3_LOXSC